MITHNINKHEGMRAGTVIVNFRTLPREKIMKQFTLERDHTCAPSVEKAIEEMRIFGGTRKGEI